jgi:hypothetical protein
MTTIIKTEAVKVDPGFKELLPGLTADERLALVESMQRDGFLSAYPILIWDETGILVDGHNRLECARAQGIATVYAERKSFASEADARAYIVTTQLMRRNLTPDQIAAACVLGGVEFPTSTKHVPAGVGAQAKELASDPSGRKLLLDVRSGTSTMIAAYRRFLRDHRPPPRARARLTPTEQRDCALRGLASQPTIHSLCEALPEQESAKQILAVIMSYSERTREKLLRDAIRAHNEGCES